MHMKLNTVADGFIQQLPEHFNEWYGIKQEVVAANNLNSITVVTRNAEGDTVTEVKSAVLSPAKVS
jgi:hypothetical protein